MAPAPDTPVALVLSQDTFDLLVNIVDNDPPLWAHGIPYRFASALVIVVLAQESGKDVATMFDANHPIDWENGRSATTLNGSRHLLTERGVRAFLQTTPAFTDDRHIKMLLPGETPVVRDYWYPKRRPKVMQFDVHHLDGEARAVSMCCTLTVQKERSEPLLGRDEINSWMQRAAHIGASLEDQIRFTALVVMNWFRRDRVLRLSDSVPAHLAPHRTHRSNPLPGVERVMDELQSLVVSDKVVDSSIFTLANWDDSRASGAMLTLGQQLKTTHTINALDLLHRMESGMSQRDSASTIPLGVPGAFASALLDDGPVSLTTAACKDFMAALQTYTNHLTWQRRQDPTLRAAITHWVNPDTHPITMDSLTSSDGKDSLVEQLQRWVKIYRRASGKEQTMVTTPARSGTITAQEFTGVWRTEAPVSFLQRPPTAGMRRPLHVSRNWHHWPTAVSTADGRQAGDAWAYYLNTLEPTRYNNCFQRLPADIHIARIASCEEPRWTATFRSYINDLPVIKQTKTLYDNIALMFARAVPILQLAWGSHPSQPASMPPISEWKDKWRPTWEQASYHVSVLQKDYDPAKEDACHEKWLKEREYCGAKVGSTFRRKKIKEVNLDDTNLQVFVSLQTHTIPPGQDTSETPHVWSQAGNTNENIVSSVLLIIDANNVRLPNLSFRSLACVLPGCAVDAAAYDPNRVSPIGEEYLKALEHPMSDDNRINCAQRHPDFQLDLVQPMIVWNNTMQMAASDASLLDPGHPGSYTLLRFDIVDPSAPIISTAEVPPQQFDWFAHELHEIIAAASPERCSLRRLPVELLDEVLEWLELQMWVDENKEKKSPTRRKCRAHFECKIDCSGGTCFYRARRRYKTGTVISRREASRREQELQRRACIISQYENERRWDAWWDPANPDLPDDDAVWGLHPEAESGEQEESEDEDEDEDVGEDED